MKLIKINLQELQDGVQHLDVSRDSLQVSTLDNYSIYTHIQQEPSKYI